MKTYYKKWLVEALKAHGNQATIPETCKHIWDNHEADLRAAGDHFFTWQYGVRWAANSMSREGKLEYGKQGRGSLWILKGV